MPAELIDTNVLLYALDRGEPRKREIAREYLRRLAATGDGCTSTQVLAEFAVNARRKCEPSLTVDETVAQLRRIQSFLSVLTIDAADVEAAVDATRAHSLSFWDGLVWATARRNEIPVIISEDGPSGAVVGGVRFENPFEGKP